MRTCRDCAAEVGYYKQLCDGCKLAARRASQRKKDRQQLARSRGSGRQTHVVLGRRGTPLERFEAKVRRTATCWLWIGATNGHGYGMLGVDGRQWRAHRWSYEQFVGPIPDGMTLDHLCGVRECVNPDHLEPVSNAENIRRYQEARRAHAPDVSLASPESGPSPAVAAGSSG